MKGFIEPSVSQKRTRLWSMSQTTGSMDRLDRKDKHACLTGIDGHFDTFCFGEERSKIFRKNLHWLLTSKVGRGKVGAVL